jgi:hypothetical protein
MRLRLYPYGSSICKDNSDSFFMDGYAYFMVNIEVINDATSNYQFDVDVSAVGVEFEGKVLDSSKINWDLLNN